MDKTEVPKYLDKSSCSGAVEITTCSEERISDEKVETTDIDSSWVWLS